MMRRDLCIIVQLGFAFLTIFSAFNSQGYIEIAVLRSVAHSAPDSGLSEHSGYYSLSIIYFVFTFSNFLAPPILKAIGSKWCMILGAACYALFMLAFLQLSAPLLYATSALLGFGAAVIWTGNGVYLVEFSRAGKMPRNSGILWAMLQGSLIAGGCFLLFVLSSSDLVSSYRLIYTVFSGVSVVGICILLFLPTSPPNTEIGDGLSDRLVSDGVEEGEAEQTEQLITTPNRDWKEEFAFTFSLIPTRPMMLLAVCFMYSGIEQASYITTTTFCGVYSACLAASTRLNGGSETLIALNVLAMGAGQIAGGLTFGMCSSHVRVGRSQVIILGTFLHLCAFFIAFLNLPMEAPLHKTGAIGYIEPSVPLALLTGLLLGLADSCWNTQIYTLLGALYKQESSAAFALFKFFQSAAACASFYYGSVFLLHWQLLILSVGAASAAIAFFTVQLEADRVESRID